MNFVLVVGLVAAGCPGPSTEETHEPIESREDWVTVSQQTSKGTRVSVALPGDWRNMVAERPLIARKATTARSGFYTNATVIVDPHTGTLDEYVAANKQALDEAETTIEIISESPRRVDGRDAYSLNYDSPGPPASSGQQLIQVVGREAITVTCWAPRGDDAMIALCSEVVATISVTPAP